MIHPPSPLVATPSTIDNAMREQNIIYTPGDIFLYNQIDVTKTHDGRRSEIVGLRRRRKRRGGRRRPSPPQPGAAAEEDVHAAIASQALQVVVHMLLDSHAGHRQGRAGWQRQDQRHLQVHGREVAGPRRGGSGQVGRDGQEGPGAVRGGGGAVPRADASAQAAAEEGSERPQKADVVLPRLQPEVPGHRPAERPDRVPKGCVEEAVGDVEVLPGG